MWGITAGLFFLAFARAEDGFWESLKANKCFFPKAAKQFAVDMHMARGDDMRYREEPRVFHKSSPGNPLNQPWHQKRISKGLQQRLARRDYVVVVLHIRRNVLGGPLFYFLSNDREPKFLGFFGYK